MLYLNYKNLLYSIDWVILLNVVSKPITWLYQSKSKPISLLMSRKWLTIGSSMIDKVPYKAQKHIRMCILWRIMHSLVSFNALYGGYPLLSYKTKKISFVLSKPKFLIYFYGSNHQCCLWGTKQLKEENLCYARRYEVRKDLQCAYLVYS